MQTNKIAILKVIIIITVTLVGVLILARWGSREGPPKVVVYSSVDQPVAGKILGEFERETGIPVRTVYDSEQTKSVGLVSILLAEPSPAQADVFWSGDPAHSLLLVKRGIALPYSSPAAFDIPPEFKSPDGSWTSLAARARVLLVNKSVMPSAEMPSSIHDLTDPRWKGQTAIGNPLFGSAAFHLAALFTVWGDEKGKQFLYDLKANKVRVARSNSEVKRLVVGGEVAFGLLDTDDASEAMKEQASMAMIYPDQENLGTLVIPSTVVLIRGGPNTEGGKKLIDFLLSKKIEQEMMGFGGYISLRAGIPAPPGLRSISDFKRMQVDYLKVAYEMDEEMASLQPWLRQWLGQ
jgi:iron(III) transport system substrate-binding protein